VVNRPRPWTTLVACLAVAWTGITARAEVERVNTEPGSGITIEIEGWAGIGTPASGRDTGLVPLEVTITNASPAAHVWTIGPDERFGRHNRPLPTATLAVPAGGTGRTTLFIAVDLIGSQMLAVQGHAVVGGASLVNLSENPMPGSDPEEIAAFRVARGQSKRVLAARAGRPADVTYVPLDMARAPTDWRGWSAFRKVLLTADEWAAMSAGGRKAALEWVSLGGHLVVFAAQRDEPRADLPAGLHGGGKWFAGEVKLVSWDGTVITEETMSAVGVGPNGMSASLATYHGQSDGIPMHGRGYGMVHDSGWAPGFGALADMFGPRTLPVAAILAFLAVFGIVAGPLNVMVFAGPGRRARMFWTTPAISLAATIFLLALMFLRDGVGGAGARRVLAMLDPARNSMAVVQEQFSRTGVLFGSSFPIREPAWMHPLMDVGGDEPLVEIDGATRSGGWFRSRSDQAYVVEAVRPSRARIEFVPRPDAAGLPAVVSSVEVPLRRVFVIDAEGLFWQGLDVGTGEKKPLQPADAADYDTWFDGLVADAGPLRKQALVAVRGLRGHAFAESDRPAKVAVQTLPAIRWIDDRAVFVCPTASGDAP